MIFEAISAELDRRKSAGDEISYYRLAKLSGVTPQQISRYLAGERDLTTTAASKILTALEIRLDKR